MVVVLLLFLATANGFGPAGRRDQKGKGGVEEGRDGAQQEESRQAMAAHHGFPGARSPVVARVVACEQGLVFGVMRLMMTLGVIGESGHNSSNYRSQWQRSGLK
jgi:hypothetical protein